jgi:hypothetical protein
MWKQSAAHYEFLRIMVVPHIHTFVYSLRRSGGIILVRKYYVRSEMNTYALHNKNIYDKL